MRQSESWQLSEWLRTEGVNAADVVPTYSIRDEIIATASAIGRLGAKVRTLTSRRERGELIVLDRTPAAIKRVA